MSKNEKFSRTADLVVAVRARHKLKYDGIILNDTFAWYLTSSMWQTILKNDFLDFLLVRILKHKYLPIQTEILIRARYTEDVLLNCISKEKLSQYVILGSGFDSFAWRYPNLSAKISIIELDKKEIINEKLRRLKEHNIPIPFNVQLLDIDFQEHDIYHVLQEGRINLKKSIFFSLLGVTFYLSEQKIYEILNDFIQNAPKGSHMIFDYLIEDKQLPNHKAKSLSKNFKKLASRKNEPVLSFFNPDDFKKKITKMGLKVMDHFTPEKQTKTYLDDLSSEIPPCHNFCLMWVKKEK